jgi:23S rRNA (cytosine1962-C5)-methyltransferase
MWKHKEVFTKIVLELLPLDVIYDKSEKTLPKVYIEEFKIQDCYLFQKKEISNTKVIENGNEFLIDWETGQKTGFFYRSKRKSSIPRRIS